MSFLPDPPANAPGRRELAWRLADQRRFLEAMLAALPTMTFDGGAGAGTRPLAGLTTRDPGDPTIALIDAWAIVGDILAFYQERILEECFVGTAREPRSLGMIAASLGYAPIQFVGAAARLAVSVEPDVEAGDVVAIPARSQVQSVPADGGGVAIFETGEPARADARRNAVVPVRQVAQRVDGDSVALVAAGTASSLAPGDSLLFGDDAEPPDAWLRVVLTAVAPQEASDTTLLRWSAPLCELWRQAGHRTAWPFAAAPAVRTVGTVANLFGYDAADWATQPYAVRNAATPSGYQPQDFATWPGFAFDPASLDLAEAYPEILPGDRLLIEAPTQDFCGTILATRTVPKQAFGLSGDVTHLDTGVLAQRPTRRSLLPGRVGHSMTALKDGTVLIAGGTDAQGRALATTQILDPASGALRFGPALPAPRSRHGAALLPDGSLVLIGGIGDAGVLDSVLHLAADGPSAGAFVTLAATLATARADARVTPIPGGGLLVSGGRGAAGVPLATAQLFDPGAMDLRPEQAMTCARADHSATAYMLAGQAYVLLAGGRDTSGVVSSAEIFVPATGFVALEAALPSARALHAADALPSATTGDPIVVLTGGQDGHGHAATPTTLVFTPNADPPQGTFAAAAAGIAPGRWSHAALVLQDGSIFVAGGFTQAGTATASTASFDPATGSAKARADLPEARADAPATMLPNGLALLAGGVGSAAGSAPLVLDSVVRVDPRLATFERLGGLPMSSADGACAVLGDGSVLATGGTGAIYLGTTATVLSGPLVDTALYDPATGLFTPAAPMATARWQHTATALPDGSVLIAGGQLAGNDAEQLEILRLIEDAASENARALVPIETIGEDSKSLSGSLWTLNTYLNAQFEGSIHCWSPGEWWGQGAFAWQTYLQPGFGTIDGEDYSYYISWQTTFFALAESIYTTTLPPFAGLIDEANTITTLSIDGASSLKSIQAAIAKDLTAAIAILPVLALFSAEIYDSSTGAFAPAGDMAFVRWGHTATLLADGRVLLVGGTGFPTSEMLEPAQPMPPGTILANAELFDSGASAFTSILAPLPQPTWWQTATRLGNGLVLIAGGMSDATSYLANALLFDPVSAQFAEVQPLLTPRARHAATLLPDGSVLITGGFTTGGAATDTAERYRPDAGLFTRLAPMLEARAAHAAELLPDGSVLVAGGVDAAGLPLASAEIFAAGSFAGPIPMNAARAAMMAARLPSGGILLAGGYADAGGGPTRSVERWVAEPIATAPETRRASRVFVAGAPVVLAPLDDPSPIGGAAIALPHPAPAFAAGEVVFASGPPPFARYVAAEPALVADAALGEARTLAPGDIVLVPARRDGAGGLVVLTVTLLEGFTGTVTSAREAFRFTLAADLDPALVAAFARPTRAEEVVVAACRPGTADVDATLILAEPLAALYDRQAFTILGNTVAVTQGESVADEVLGSGDGTAAFQTFELACRPVTSVASADGGGIVPAVEIRVNEIAWSRVRELAEAGPEDQVHALAVDLAGTGRITFGDGINGARLPTGLDNVTATYRHGAGPGGNVAAGAISVPPPAIGRIAAVTNPMPAAGGVGAAGGVLRGRIPLSVATLDRLVDLADYGAFALDFPGVLRAQAVAPPVGPDAPDVFITIAGPGDASPAPRSALALALAAAIEAAQVPGHRITLGGYGRRYFDVAAEIGIDPRRRPEPLLAALTSMLARAYGFAARDFGQPIEASAIVARLQGVAGVRSVRLTALHDSARPAALLPILGVRPVRWDNGRLEAAEILVVNPRGIMLVEARR